MIFNKDNNGAKELRRLTGNYFASNDFSNIQADIEQATDDLRRIIGKEVLERADKAYQLAGSPASDLESNLVELVQRPIALLASLRYFRKNDISHEDSGRKVKLSSDNTEKIPWEWQLDRDDAILLEQYYQAVERLIRFLGENGISEWTESDTCKSFKSLLIRSGREFDRYFPIEQSERMFILLSSFIREVQLCTIKPAFGKGWDVLLDESSVPESDIRFAACKALALQTMAVAFRRMPLQLIPSGVIRTYMAENGSRNSTPATLEEVRTLSGWLEQDAMDWIERMKKLRDGEQPDVELLPLNDKRNKFCRL